MTQLRSRLQILGAIVVADAVAPGSRFATQAAYDH